MPESAYIVTSGSEATGEEKSSTFFEIAIGIDLGTSQCSIAVWSGFRVELLKNTRNEKIMKLYVTFKSDTPSVESAVNPPSRMRCSLEPPFST